MINKRLGRRNLFLVVVLVVLATLVGDAAFASMRLRSRVTTEAGPLAAIVTVTGVIGPEDITGVIGPEDITGVIGPEDFRATIVVTFDGVKMGEGESDTSGQFRVTFPVRVAARGPHVVTVRAPEKGLVDTHELMLPEL
ncbi:MAG: hypothetical protein M3198_19915 [Actinomycetota bacterium]|nr:hypothetical protein [Actinomycetota bacterium]